MMYLETERLIVRSLQQSDELPFIEMASDGSLTEIYGDCSECNKWMGKFISEAMELEALNNPRNEYLAFAIEEKVSHAVVGSVGSSFYEDFDEVGVTYFIGAKYRGNGYTAEALLSFVNYLCTNYDISKLVATANVHNIASCKTLEQAGFVLVETKMYQDLYDPCKEMSNIYVREK
jgi:ribosomal-protein-alanine N-acetyltransferase